MELIYPGYYEKFHCIAGACPDSCCQEWDVEVDSESVKFYRGLQGPLGEKVRRYLYEEDGTVYLGFPEGKCPMQRPDGLCGIQAELGPEALCQVCQKYPRLTQDYGEFLELDLEMSCPEAARIMMTEDGWELHSRQVDGGEPGEYDHEVMEILRRTRPRMMALAQDRRFGVNERLALMLLYGAQVQHEIDCGEEIPFDPEQGLETVREIAGDGDFEAVLSFFGELEILTDRWRELLAGARRESRWFESLSRLAGYGIYRYYYQAVSDYDLISRVKMVVLSCILTAHLAGRPLQSQIDTVQLYSKEIENDADNVDAILEASCTCAWFSDRSVLGMLLE